MKNKIISLALALLMLAAVIPFTTIPALAASSYSYEEIIPLKYEDAWAFSEGLAAVKLDGKWGFIDKSGTTIIPFQYDDVATSLDGINNVFQEGLAGVQIEGKFGFIDKTGEVVIPFIYDSVLPFCEGMAAVKRDVNIGYIDKTGKEVIPPKYQSYNTSLFWINNFRDGLAVIMVGDKDAPLKVRFGIVDKAGNEVIPPIYSDYSNFSSRAVSEEGVVALELDGKWGYVDITGKDVLPFIYDDARLFSEGLAAVNIDGKWGFIDTDGNEVLPFLYDDAYTFEEGLAAVKLGWAWGFIDKAGTMVVQPKYGGVWGFENGVATVELGGKRSLVDKTGKELLPFKYKYFYFGDKKYSMAYGGDSPVTVIDISGEEIVSPGKYNTIDFGLDSTARVGRVHYNSDGSFLGYRWGYINITETSEAPNLDTAATWALEGIQSAVVKGFVPSDIQNNYTAVITRAEFCRMAVKFVEYATGKDIDAILSDKGLTRNPNAFTDTSDPDILAAFALGITNGTGNGTFTPNGQFSREQAATMIMNSCKVIGLDTAAPTQSDFADIGSASTWAIDGISFVQANGIMNGTGNNNFTPKGTYTRQESIVTFDRIK